jgi:hypothetical protein
MCIATEQTCETCGKAYLQGDMRRDHYLKCDDCRGIKHKEEKPFDKVEWLKEIIRLQVK